MMGVTPERAVAELQDAGADIVGANCGNGIEVMVELARELRGATDAPLLVHCNAGIPAVQRGEIVYPVRSSRRRGSWRGGSGRWWRMWA